MRINIFTAILLFLMTFNLSSQVSEPILIEISIIPSPPPVDSTCQIAVLAAFANCCQPLYGYDVEEKDSTFVINLYYDGRGSVMGMFGETLDSISIPNLKAGTARIIAHSYSIFGLNSTIDTSSITASDTIHINTTGINEFSLEEAIITHPNPANGVIHIQVKGDIHFTSLILIDNQGRKIKEYEKNEKELNVARLSSGIYFLKFQTEKEEITKKIIVQ